MSNTFRKVYRELSVTEQEHIEQIKDAAERLEQLIYNTALRGDPERHRQTRLALTNLEQSVMWATKAAT